jgi:hypothetical protein
VRDVGARGHSGGGFFGGRRFSPGVHELKVHTTSNCFFQDFEIGDKVCAECSENMVVHFRRQVPPGRHCGGREETMKKGQNSGGFLRHLNRWLTNDVRRAINLSISIKMISLRKAPSRLRVTVSCLGAILPYVEKRWGRGSQWHTCEVLQDTKFRPNKVWSRAGKRFDNQLRLPPFWLFSKFSRPRLSTLVYRWGGKCPFTTPLLPRQTRGMRSLERLGRCKPSQPEVVQLIIL